MEQSPGETKVTVASNTVQIVVVADVKVTGNPEVADARRVTVFVPDKMFNAAGITLSPIFEKLIVWGDEGKLNARVTGEA